MPFTTNPRNAWYDRNPAPISRNYGAQNLAPHAFTIRWSYTVPTNKKFFWSSSYLRASRTTAAGVAGFTYASFTYTAVGQTGTSLYAAILSATVDVREVVTVEPNMIMFEGDVIEGGTFDGSTGGTCWIVTTLFGSEFDE